MTYDLVIPKPCADSSDIISHQRGIILRIVIVGNYVNKCPLEGAPSTDAPHSYSPSNQTVNDTDMKIIDTCQKVRESTVHGCYGLAIG